MNSMVGLAVGICGAVFIGYCIYFDNKRRSDPNFKKRLRERRKAARDAAVRGQIPHLKDSEAYQKFFLQEVQLGETLLAQGDLTNGIEHLANAVAVCGQQTQLLGVLGGTLPPQVYQMLLQRLALLRKQNRFGAYGGPQIIGMAEEDVE